MKLRIAVLSVLCISLVCIGTQVYAQKITVLNPMGTPPPIQAKEMAPRMATLDGKTIYFVNTGYIGTDRLMAEMMAWFKETYPKTNLVLRSGSMESIPANVLTEIGQKADGAIVGLGH
jgi:hypothetical protein